jgi:hypothetical protein
MMRIQKVRVAMGELDIVGQNVWDHVAPRPRIGRVVSESVLNRSSPAYRCVQMTMIDTRELISSPPFASQASAMSQSSGTTYSTGTGSTSSATTLTSPGTSKGSWGDMMTSTNTGQVNQARPLPIPEGQSGKLDPVSLLAIWLEQKLILATFHTRPRPSINIRLNANSS